MFYDLASQKAKRQLLEVAFFLLSKTRLPISVGNVESR